MPLPSRNLMAEPMTETTISGTSAQRGSIPRLRDMVFTRDTDHHGTGPGLALMNRVAFMAATRFGRMFFVTVSFERIDFRTPASIGQIVEATARPASDQVSAECCPSHESEA
jgi:acyl-CoA hydrolase